MMSHFLPPEVSESLKTKPEPPTASFKSVTPKVDLTKPSRASSLGDWWRNMLPSQRPERGGTVREQHFRDGFDSLKDASRPRRRATDNRLSRRSETADSDRLTRWNTPKDLPKEQLKKTALERRAVSGGLEMTYSEASDRKWSWAPRVQVPEQLTVNEPRSGERKVSWKDLRLDEEPDIDLGSQASLLAGRRLSDARRMIEAKKEVRRQRRSLKESGDYLGVQGINPETGKLDILTPSRSDNSADSQEAELKIKALKLALKNARDANKATTMQSEREAKRLLLKKEKEKLDKSEKKKEELSRQSEGLKWHRHSKQWSSAQEPELSPIAQSLRSGTPVSRRPSQPMQQTGDTAELVDLNSPLKREAAEELLANPTPPEASGTTSQASGTVIHTPHRRSVARDKPAALELFENGISFDDSEWFSDPSFNANKDKNVDSSYTTPAKVDRKMPGNSHRSLELHDIGDGLSTRANQGSEQSEMQSFLHMTAPGDVASRGSIPRPVSTNNLLQPLKDSTPARSFSLSSSKKHKRQIIMAQTAGGIDHQKSNRPGGTDSLKATERLIDDTLKADETLNVGGGTLSHSLSPRNLWSHLKRRVGEGPGKSLSPLTNIDTAERPSSPGVGTSAASQNALSGTVTQVHHQRMSTQHSIKKDMDYLKKEVAKADELHWMKEKKQLGPQNADLQWIEGTIRDITEKGDRIKEIPAYTPTTTTTGSDPEMSGTNRHGEVTSVDYSNRLDCGEQVGIVTSSKSPTSPQKKAPSSLLKLTPEGQIVPVDITSAEDVVLEQQPKEKQGFLQMIYDHRNRTRKLAEGRYNTLPTSTSTQAPETIKNLRGDRLSEELGKSHGIRKLRQPKPRFQNPAPLVTQTPNGQNLGKSAIEFHRRGLWKEVMDQREEERLQQLMRTCPGAYPSHLDVADATVDRFAGPRMYQTGTMALDLHNRRNGNSWTALLEFLFVVRCHIIVVARLYWGLAGPVFNSSSDYWERNATGRATLKDAVAFVLAIPGAFAGILVFV